MTLKELIESIDAFSVVKVNYLFNGVTEEVLFELATIIRHNQTEMGELEHKTLMSSRVWKIKPINFADCGAVEVLVGE